LARQAVEKSSPDDLEAVAERHALSKQELESAIEHLAQGGR